MPRKAGYTARDLVALTRWVLLWVKQSRSASAIPADELVRRWNQSVKGKTKMKRLCGALLCLVGALLAAPMFCQEAKDTSAPALSKVEGSHAVRPFVPLDARFRELQNDRNVIAALVEFTQNAKGAVTLRYSVAELRKLDEEKLRALRAWLKEKGVPEQLEGTGWSFDPARQAFVPPAAKPTAEPAKDAEVKKP